MWSLITILFIITMAHGAYFRSTYDINNITSMTSPYTIQNCTDVGYISSQCSYHGICLSDGNCDCDKGYITHNSDIACNYEQKSKYIAFLLSFFLGMVGGGGEWYLNNTELALGQLLFFWVVPIGACIIGCCLSILARDESAGKCVSAAISACWGFGIIIWWICDWAFILNGDRTDSNGVSTYDGM